MKRITYKVCKLIPYMPYQNCKNILCKNMKGCSYISLFEKNIKGFNKDRLKTVNNYEKYKMNYVKENNLTLNEDVFPDDLE